MLIAVLWCIGLRLVYGFDITTAIPAVSTGEYPEVWTRTNLNVTGPYKGSWTLWRNETIKAVEVLKRERGVVHMQLRSDPTFHSDFQAVRGDIIIWDGDFSTVDDMRVPVRGIFHIPSGQVAASSYGLPILASSHMTGLNQTALQWLLDSTTAKATKDDNRDDFWEMSLHGVGRCGLQLTMRALQPLPRIPSEPEEREESLAFGNVLSPLKGVIRSDECDFGLFVEATGMPLEDIFEKAIWGLDIFLALRCLHRVFNLTDLT